jgi:hypothetical protein
VAALQFISFGLLGELLTRIYFNDASHRPYVVETVLDASQSALTAISDPGVEDRGDLERAGKANNGDQPAVSVKGG